MCISNFIIIAPLRDQFTIQLKANASELEKKNHDWLKTQDYNWSGGVGQAPSARDKINIP